MEHKDACTNSIGFQSGSNLRQDGMLGPLGSVVRRLQRVRLGRKLRGTQSHSSSVTTCSCYQEVSAPAKAAKPLPSINDVFAGGAARAAAQATIHPLDTLKVRMQATDVVKAPSPLCKARENFGVRMGGQVRTLYRGVGSAAGGAGIAIGAYFAFYGTATKVLQERTELPVGAVAFAAGGLAALGSAFVKVPLAVTIRSVQAGVYKNPVQAARTIVAGAGVRGLFTGLVPTILEDIPDMAVKFASYEMMHVLHASVTGGRARSVHEDLAMGGAAGAGAAAATTPFDVVKTRMMCEAKNKPTVVGSAAAVYHQGGGKAFFRGVGPRTASNAINSALFFCLFEAIRQSMKARKLQLATKAMPAVHTSPKQYRPMEACLTKCSSTAGLQN